VTLIIIADTFTCTLFMGQVDCVCIEVTGQVIGHVDQVLVGKKISDCLHACPMNAGQKEL
jgi:hypothetical protein